VSVALLIPSRGRAVAYQRRLLKRGLMKAAGRNRYGHRDATMILMAFRQKPI
jgi:hypothetical protein